MSTLVTLPLSSMSLPMAPIVLTSSVTSTSSVTMPTKMQSSFSVANSGPGKKDQGNRSSFVWFCFVFFKPSQERNIGAYLLRRWFQCQTLATSSKAQNLFSLLPVFSCSHLFHQSEDRTLINKKIRLKKIIHIYKKVMFGCDALLD